MKNILYISCFLLVTMAVMALMKAGQERPAPALQMRDIMGCAPAPDGAVKLKDNGKFISVLPGWGSHGYDISTGNDSARFYFNQGLTMYYGYHMKEALASFKEATRFDTTCAMLYWGQALAMGPTYNGGYAYSMSREVPALIERMNQYAGTATGKEKELIAVMNTRYDVHDLSDGKRKQLNLDYANAMQLLNTRYPGDTEILSLYIDAMMLAHPWDFWNNDGTPKSWTPELVQLCESVLQKDPQHPAGLHYYIHLTEASRKPEVALPAADSLRVLFPGIAHMVHMSSHQYERIGHFEKGVQVNDQAGRSLEEYARLEKELSLMTRSSHYYAVGTYCAMSGAMYEEAMRKANMIREVVDPSHDNTYEQYLYMFPVLTKVRMGKWQEILDDTTVIPGDWTYANILDNFSKGMAYAKTGSSRKAEKCLKVLKQLATDVILKKRFVPHMSSPYECTVIAENLLSANISFAKGKREAAVKAAEAAIAAEDKLIYTEPKLWMLPARQYLGAFLLQMNRAADAEIAYREDLQWNPGHGWSLLGLHQALQQQKKYDELERVKQQYELSFSGASVFPSASAY